MSTTFFKSFIFLFLIAAFGFSFFPGPIKKQPSETKPNVVLIIADDLGKFDLSIYGGLNIKTPNIDSIGLQGVAFENGYATASICAPSRAALLTGQYQQRFGFEFQPHRNYPNSFLEKMYVHWMLRKSGWTMNSNDSLPKNKLNKTNGLPLCAPTLAEILQWNGYETGMFGKWHLGYADSCLPNTRGFKTHYGFYEAFSLYDRKRDKEVVNYKHRANFTDRYMWRRGRKGDCSIRFNDSLIHEKEYLTFAIAREANTFIRENKNKPFFLYVPFSAPHEPFQAPLSYYNKLSHITNKNLRVYLAMIQALDDAVGMIVKELREQGLEQNTLIVFTSDNGAAMYTQAVTNLPLNGGKFMNFEGGVNVPFLMKWPAKISSPAKLKMNASLLDVFPTFLKACIGSCKYETDGVDLIPFAISQKGNPHERLFWRSGYNYAARIGNWKLIIDEKNKTLDLYNLEKDEAERENEAVLQENLVRQFKEEIKKWEEEMREPLWTYIMNYKIRVNGKVYHYAI